MTCILDQYTLYQLNNVRYDQSADKYIVSINNPPKSCPQAQFVGKAEMSVDPKLNSSILTYSTVIRKPQIIVPDLKMIQIINVPIHHPFLWLGVALIVGGVFSWLIKKMLDSIERYEINKAMRFHEVNKAKKEEKLVIDNSNSTYSTYLIKPTIEWDSVTKAVISGAIGGAAGAGAVLAYNALTKDKEDNVSNFDTTAMSIPDPSLLQSNVSSSNSSSSFNSESSSFSSDNLSFSSDDSFFSSDSSSFSSDSSSFNGD